MEKKKVIIINNHFQYSDGTVNAMIGMLNNLELDKFDITVLPIYRCDREREKELPDGVRLQKGFGFYFKGFSTIVRKIPMKWLYRRFIGGKYDIEIAYQCDVPTMLVGNSQNKSAVHVAWMHGYDLYEKEYACCDKVVCVSKYCADKTKAEMGDRVDVTYRYNLVDDAPIRQRAKEDIDIELPDTLLLASVGRLSPEKGYVRLVKILGELKDEGLNFHLLLVGDGPERQAIEDEIEICGMREHITLTGSQTNPHKYTARADVFICSSFSEGYSTACTEAAILGVPIITTAVPGGEEIIGECECGMLTSLEDEALKSAIRYAIQNPSVVSEWKNTMKRTSDKFALDKRKRDMLDLFDELYALSDTKISAKE